jgi:hypothetical protein
MGVSMTEQIPRAVTITAHQAQIAASRFPGDWKRKKRERKRIKLYGQSNREFLKQLGARIKISPN